jgi:signal transduction histidine kinase
MPDSMLRSTSSVAAPAKVEEHLSRIEQEAQRLKDQLRHSQRLATLGTAAAMLAHEFNNMMTPIVGYARFALNRNDPELMTKALEITVTQAEAVTTMAERILGMAAHEPVAFKSVALGEVVEETVKCLCRDVSKDGITLKIAIDGDIRVWGDPRQLQHVFLNLLLNARDALQDLVGNITVSAAIDDDDVVIEFTDTGKGIPAGEMDAIFEPFFTTKHSDNGDGKRGSGLGLALCKDIVEEHRGAIAVQSQAGKSTTFTITLPSAR